MPNSRIQIAYLSVNDPKDIHAWSGIHYSIFNTLQRNIGDVTALGPYKNSRIELLVKLKKIWYQLIFKKRYNKYHSSLVAKDYGKYFSKKLQEKKFDLIVAISASAELAYLDTSVPIVFMSDALFTGSLNYYVTLSNLCKASLKEGFDTENKALHKANLLYLPSEWVKQNAVNDFKIPDNKIAIGPMGANLENIPSAQFVLDFKRKKDNSFINLIFVGVNWENKGGPKAYDCLMELLKMGYKAKLTIVGCAVPEHYKNENLINIPFIKKTTPEGRKQFEDLYMNADFHILPTKFEAYGIVFCEASAYGVINIACNTGGTSTPISDGENGILMLPESKGKDYAKNVAEIYSNKKRFEDMQLTARKRYDEVLNWDTWALNLKALLPIKK